MLIAQTWSTPTSAVGNRGSSPCRDCVAPASDGVTGAATAQAGPWGDAYLPVTGLQAYHPGVDDLRAIPRIDIYGEDVARHVLNGDYREWSPALVTGVTYTAWGGSNHSFVVASGGGSGGGGGVSGGCSSVTSGWGSGGSGGLNYSPWTSVTYGNLVVRRGDMITITGI